VSAAFTPGPWSARAKFGHDDLSHVFWEERGAGWVRSRRLDVAHTAAFTTVDARLIAAAPELYGALSDIMENPLFQTAIGGNPNMVEALMERAKDALAKARGEQVPA
jgi:hypothetical protein